MKAKSLCLSVLCAGLFAVSTVVAAPVSAYPPVLDASVYQATSAPVKVNPTVSQLRHQISTLKTLIQQQSVAINALNKKLLVMPVGHKNRNPAAVKAEEKIYKSAIGLFKKGHYSPATVAFQKILLQYPTGKYASNAQFWVGELLLKKGNKQAALLAFDRVLRVYPNSGKVPDSLYKLGAIELNLGRGDKAAEYFNYVIQYYPNSNAAQLAMTKKVHVGLV